MVLGALRVEFFLAECHSLKGKRKVVRSMVDKVKAKFNVSIAEIDSNDKWQKIELGIAVVGNDRRYVDSCLNHVRDFLESLYLAELIHAETEVINL
ncbi:conserved hypothetical protein [uncultured Desulfatiglans sp.]|uniref:DUF503 domain-containing protein n=1 Tax=Uncultured Desulfatiglans sp. TaxID=1748965 RepID=A0A653A8R9_UNCDX|nr:conserved hypothetical protein [uncultured Desulfatiglans sp.]